MQYQIFVQNQSPKHFIASVVGIPNLVVEGQTEAEAINNVKAALEEQLAKGKLVTIEIPPQNESPSTVASMKYAGVFEDDQTFEDFMQHLARIRQEANRIDEQG